MSQPIDYYFTPQSPWTYLGHERFARIARASGRAVRMLPTDFGKVFAVSGGLPLGQRAPQRQAYRLVELQRFSDFLQLPLNLKPQFFPVSGDAAARLIIAVDQHDGVDAAMQLGSTIFSSVWAHQRNIADDVALAALLASCGLDAGRLGQSNSAAVQTQYDANTQQAIDKGIFGAPSYVLDGEIFWGQDRLDFLERKILST